MAGIETILNNGMIAVFNPNRSNQMEPAGGRYAYPVSGSQYTYFKGTEFSWDPAVNYLTGDIVALDGSSKKMRLAANNDRTTYLVTRGKDYQDAQLVCTIIDGVTDVMTNCFADGVFATLTVGDELSAVAGKLTKKANAGGGAIAQWVVTQTDYNPLFEVPGGKQAKFALIRRI